MGKHRKFNYNWYILKQNTKVCSINMVGTSKSFLKKWHSGSVGEVYIWNILNANKTLATINYHDDMTTFNFSQVTERWDRSCRGVNLFHNCLPSFYDRYIEPVGWMDMTWAGLEDYTGSKKLSWFEYIQLYAKTNSDQVKSIYFGLDQFN